MHAVRTTQAIFSEKGLAGDERVVECFRKTGCIIGMEGPPYGCRQPAHTRLFYIRYVHSKKIDQALVEERRIAIRFQTRDGDRHHADELSQLPLALPERLFGMHLVFYVLTEAVPLNDA